MKVEEYFTKPRIIALSIVATSMFYIIVSHEFITIYDIVSLLGMVLFCLLGIIVLAIPKLDRYTCLGIDVLAFGILMVSKFVIYPDIPMGLLYAIYIAQIFLGTYCIILSFLVLCGSRYDVTRMRLVSLIYIISMGIPLALEVTFHQQNFFEMLWKYNYEVVIILPFVLYIAFSGSADLGYKTRKSRFKQNVNSLSDVMYTDPNAYLMRNDIMKMRDVEDWEQHDDGFVIARTSVPLYIDKKKRYIEAQKWKDGTIRASITPGDAGTLMMSLRMEFMEIVPDDGDFNTCKSITFYINGGFFIRINVKDDQVKREVNKFVMFLYKVMGYNVSDYL